MRPEAFTRANKRGPLTCTIMNALDSKAIINDCENTPHNATVHSLHRAAVVIDFTEYSLMMAATPQPAPVVTM